MLGAKPSAASRKWQESGLDARWRAGGRQGYRHVTAGEAAESACLALTGRTLLAWKHVTLSCCLFPVYKVVRCEFN